MFEAFGRGAPSRSRASGGNCLGLAVVKAIAQAHDGHALCQPCGAETRFVIQLPLRSDTAVE